MVASYICHNLAVGIFQLSFLMETPPVVIREVVRAYGLSLRVSGVSTSAVVFSKAKTITSIGTDAERFLEVTVRLKSTTV